jgi:hypothetical protein
MADQSPAPRAIGTPFAFVEVVHLHGNEDWKNYLFAPRGRKFVRTSHFQCDIRANVRED